MSWNVCLLRLKVNHALPPILHKATITQQADATLRSHPPLMIARDGDDIGLFSCTSILIRLVAGETS